MERPLIQIYSIVMQTLDQLHLEELAMMQITIQLIINQNYPQANAAAMMQANTTSRIIMALNAQVMLMTACGQLEMHKHPTLETRNTGATSMNGMNALQMPI